jgi:hypothetical protein
MASKEYIPKGKVSLGRRPIKKKSPFPTAGTMRKILLDLTDLPTLLMLYRTWVLLFRGGGFRLWVASCATGLLLRILPTSGVR